VFKPNFNAASWAFTAVFFFAHDHSYIAFTTGPRFTIHTYPSPILTAKGGEKTPPENYNFICSDNSQFQSP
jgi:hypothetical protein